MTIRRRLIFAFAAILILLAVNQAIFVWSSHLRSSSVQSVSRALTRQVIIGSIRHNIDDLHKQITLLTQLEGGGGGPIPPQVRDTINQKLLSVRTQMIQLRNLSDPDFRSQVDDIAAEINVLSDSWRGFIENLGVDQTKATEELIKADPFARQVLTKSLPNLQDAEQERQRAAQQELERVSVVTERTVIVIFVLSIIVAGWVAYRVAKHINDKLADLTRGTEFFGQGIMDYRIDVRSRDELGQLARAFNDMRDNLAMAREGLLSSNKELEERAVELENQRRVSESLLLNILPSEVAQELQQKGAVEPMYFEDVTIIFTDFVGFTLSTEKLAAEDLVTMLHDYFTAFDHIVTRYRLEKLKTIGDSYMCVSGLPVAQRGLRTPSHPVDAVLAAFEMVSAVRQRERTSQHDVRWSVRIGVHTGPVVAGVVGIQKFAFDVWGDTVNYASRMESSGQPNRVNMSADTYRRVKDFFACEYRGKVMTKDKRETDMYFADGILPSLLDGEGETPPPAFLRRYRVYFQNEPPDFPPFFAPEIKAPEVSAPAPEKYSAEAQS